MEKKTTVAIVLPVFNEQALIAATLEHLLSLGADEVIVVDGNSTDGTPDIVRDRFPRVCCLQTAAGDRSLQMNVGALEANSEVLLFVHADMKLPSRGITMVREAVRGGSIGGGFRKRYEPSTPLLNLYSYFLNAIYLSMLHCMVGTNAIFVTKKVFEKLYGYPEMPLLEDVVFCDALRKEGKITILREPVTASSRRYLQDGILTRVIRNAHILFDFKMLHRSPEHLQEKYQYKDVS